jgi:hypothetical protein
MCLKIILSRDHSQKNYTIFTMVFTIIFRFYFFKTSYLYIIFLHVLISTSNIKLLNANYEPKTLITTPCILKERSGWMVNHIPLHTFPMYQTNHHVSLIIFHLSMNRFSIIDSFKFDQVYIFDTPLLLTRNSYLNYS